MVGGVSPAEPGVGEGRLPVKFSMWAGAATQGPLATTAATWALLPGGGHRQAPPEAGPVSACAPAWGPERPALWEAAVAVEQEARGESQLPGLWFLLPEGAP